MLNVLTSLSCLKTKNTICGNKEGYYYLSWTWFHESAFYHGVKL